MKEGRLRAPLSFYGLCTFFQRIPFPFEAEDLFLRKDNSRAFDFCRSCYHYNAYLPQGSSHALNGENHV